MEYDNREGLGQDPASLSFPLRSFLGCPDHLHHHHHPPIPPQTAHKISPIHTKIWKENRPQSLSVLMPGDEVPRFIAMACPPCTAAALVEIVVQKPSQSLPNSSL
ncbi:unnamed protein product [Citrullus colocynthis]|uniref:Uncharacterized protein n=1 Tax=Citrullus colocynthis TaxID=252529 RepID=A0ABP0YYB0_9ROSI